jgi:sigma-B regulation protein RsbU (phosphoserine phosphatase)
MNQKSSPSRLLVVDDEVMNRKLLAMRLRQEGYHVTLAPDGCEALACIDRLPLDLVVLDIMMPGLDGMQVLAKIRERLAPAALPVIMATAKDDNQDVVQALKQGANDYVIKPVDFDILQARIQTQVRLKHMTTALEEANERMSQELLAAAEIQKSLLPKPLPEPAGIDLAWTYHPCEELGGDILNLFKLGDDHLGLYLLDVSGHGVPAALLSSALSHLLTPNRSEGSLLWEHMDDPEGPTLVNPSTVAGRLQSRFDFNADTCQFFTLHYGLLDLRERCYRYVSAGHPPPLLLNACGEAKIVEGTSPAIGLIENPVFGDHCIELKRGDRLVVYSDGLIEAVNAQDDDFDTSGLMDAFSTTRHECLDDSLSHVVATVENWAEGHPQDDVSMFALEVKE